MEACITFFENPFNTINGNRTRRKLILQVKKKICDPVVNNQHMIQTFWELTDSYRQMHKLQAVFGVSFP